MEELVASAITEETGREAKILPIPGAGHWIAEERPEAFAAGLIDFLGPHSDGGGCRAFPKNDLSQRSVRPTDEFPTKELS